MPADGDAPPARPSGPATHRAGVVVHPLEQVGEGHRPADVIALDVAAAVPPRTAARAPRAVADSFPNTLLASRDVLVEMMGKEDALEVMLLNPAVLQARAALT